METFVKTVFNTDRKALEIAWLKLNQGGYDTCVLPESLGRKIFYFDFKFR